MYKIYRGTFSCKWCDLAITTLENNGLPFEVIRLEMADVIEKWVETGMKTVPVIFKNDRLVGGCTELLEELKNAE